MITYQITIFIDELGLSDTVYAILSHKYVNINADAHNYVENDVDFHKKDGIRRVNPARQ